MGAPYTFIILFTSASQVAPGSGGCIMMYRVLWQLTQKLCTSCFPSPSANSGTKDGYAPTSYFASGANTGAAPCPILAALEEPYDPLLICAKTKPPASAIATPTGMSAIFNRFSIAALLNSFFPQPALVSQSCSTSSRWDSKPARLAARFLFHPWPSRQSNTCPAFLVSMAPASFGKNRRHDPRRVRPPSRCYRHHRKLPL